MKEQPMSDEKKSMGQVIQIDEARIRDHLGEMVRGTVEELNAMLDAEADQLCDAGRYAAARDTGLAVMNGRCRPAPASSTSRFRSCGVDL
jgi:hypothetical protein